MSSQNRFSFVSAGLWIALAVFACGAQGPATSKAGTAPLAPSRAVVFSTYYVRSDGGSAEQCTGRVDAPYPGSGSAQPCAWSHPFWALDANGQWKLQGGDTLVIHSGSYKMGLGAPNTDGWCFSEYSWDCHPPALPSGPNAANSTRILGVGWDYGCSNPPQLWGSERAQEILDLTATSNAEINCLEITDHSSCALDHCTAGVSCRRDSPPYGDQADVGLIASDSTNVTLRHLNIHGLARAGIWAGRLTDWTMEDVRLAGNGGAGWDGDIGESSSNSGTITLRRVTVEWNGCPEAYPDQQPSHCWGQETCGGYGDGVGVDRSGGHWVIEDSRIRYNVSDGLDLLYVSVDHPDSLVEIRRSMAYGNGGNQLKVGGTSRIINSLVVANCGYFYQKPFAQEMGNLDSGDHCRAGGGAISINLPRGHEAAIVNCTIASQGWAGIEVQCITANFPDQPACNGTERLSIANSIIRGYQVVYLDYERLSDFVGDGDPGHFTTASTVDYDLTFNAEISSPTGTHTILQDPLFLNPDINNLDGHLQAGSPAIDTGLPVGSLGGLVPSDDLTGFHRPVGSVVDRGAYERWVPQAWICLPIILKRY